MSGTTTSKRCTNARERKEEFMSRRWELTVLCPRCGKPMFAEQVFNEDHRAYKPARYRVFCNETDCEDVQGVTEIADSFFASFDNEDEAIVAAGNSFAEMLRKDWFEDHPVLMDFSAVLALLNAGKKVARQGWNGKGMFLFAVRNWHVDDEPSPGGLAVYECPTVPFIAMKTADNKLVPWLASQTDLLAEDWETVE